jgi:hypothetical protein
MSASPASVDSVAAPRIPFRMPRAELLKLRKRRGLVIPSALLTVGVVVLFFLVAEVVHLVNPGHHPPVGGSENFRSAVFVMSRLAGMVAAVLVGSFAATGDTDSGVFRELVATGRSRTHLFLAHIPGGLALLWTLVAAAYAVLVACTLGFAGFNPTPSSGEFFKTLLWLGLASALPFVLALGLGALTNSRAATISIILAWLLIVDPILSAVNLFGAAREGLSSVALERLSPIPPDSGDHHVGSSLGVALLAVALWIAIPLAAGLWRTRTRDA